MLHKLLLFLPLILFFGLIFIFNFIGPFKKFNSKLNNIPLISSVSIVILLLICGLIFIAFFDGYDIESNYTAPYSENGKLIKGKFKSK